MGDIDQTPPILALPLELRELIYKSVLSDPSQGPQLLRACREIYSEASKFLFQRPMLFHSQTALYRWLDQAPAEQLHHIIDVKLELQDVDLRPLLSPVPGSSSTSTMPRLLAWEFYEHELIRLDEALRKFPNVKTYTLRAIPERQSFLFREFLAKVLESLGSLYPNLTSLALEGHLHHQSLSFLSSHRNLESLSFDGFSSSSPAETATILSNLTHLSNLSLVSQHALLTPITHQHSTFTSKRQSLTTPVLLAMKQLASLSLTETIHPITTPPLFFTPEVLASLREHSTLNNLSIRLSQAPSIEILEVFEDFLDNAPGIEILELDWPGLEPNVLERYALLPDRVTDFWVRCEGMEKAFDILWTVMESRKAGDLSALRRVVLMKGMWDNAIGVAVDTDQIEDDKAVEDEYDDSDNGGDDTENKDKAADQEAKPEEKSKDEDEAEAGNENGEVNTELDVSPSLALALDARVSRFNALYPSLPRIFSPSSHQLLSFAALYRHISFLPILFHIRPLFKDIDQCFTPQDDPTTNDTDEMTIALVKRSLKSLGVEVAWCTEGQ